MKKIKNLLLASILTFSVVSNVVPFSINVSAQEVGDYTLGQSVSVYLTAQDARLMKNPIKTYAPGNYFIYREEGGMLNISKYEGGAGGWINPSGVSQEDTATTKEVITTEEEIITTVEKIETTTKVAKEKEVQEDEDTFKLYSSTKKYSTASDAKSNRNSLGSYNAGNYYIYKSANGMLNISKSKGAPGAWINPNGNEVKDTLKETTTPKTVASTKSQTSAPTTKTQNVEDGKFVLSTPTAAYITARDAAKGTNPVKTYAAGTYYIYKSYNGMINVSKKKGSAGSWINPGNGSYTSSSKTTPIITTTAKSTKAVTNITTPATKATNSQIIGKEYVVTASTPVYVTASDAKGLKNSIKSYAAGKYYVYKNVDGMLNISKTPGVAGGWINPSGLKNISTTTSKIDGTTTPIKDTNGFKYPKTQDPKTAAKLIAPIVQKYDDEGGMLNSVKIAQILLESGNLTSELFVKANNPAGIKFSNPFSTVHPTWYYVKDSVEYGSSMVTSAFRKYPSVDEGIKDFSNIYTSSPYRKQLYAKALNAKNYKDQANALTGVYATSSDYGSKLINIIEKYNLTQYD